MYYFLHFIRGKLGLIGYGIENPFQCISKENVCNLMTRGHFIDFLKVIRNLNTFFAHIILNPSLYYVKNIFFLFFVAFHQFFANFIRSQTFAREETKKQRTKRGRDFNLGGFYKYNKTLDRHGKEVNCYYIK